MCVFAYGAGEKRRNKDKRTQSNIVAKTKANMTPTNKNQTKNRLLRRRTTKHFHIFKTKMQEKRTTPAAVKVTEKKSKVKKAHSTYFLGVFNVFQFEIKWIGIFYAFIHLFGCFKSLSILGCYATRIRTHLHTLLPLQVKWAFEFCWWQPSYCHAVPVCARLTETISWNTYTRTWDWYSHHFTFPKHWGSFHLRWNHDIFRWICLKRK